MSCLVKCQTNVKLGKTNVHELIYDRKKLGMPRNSGHGGVMQRKKRLNLDYVIKTRNSFEFNHFLSNSCSVVLKTCGVKQ